MTVEVTLQDGRDDEDGDVPSASDFEHWVNLVAGDVADTRRLTVRIVDSSESRQLNCQYRGKDYPTNVLSFAYDDDELLSATGQQPSLGDLVICADIVNKEADEQERPPADHWAHMTIHGVLHLLGYDHQTADQAEAMENLEKQLLASIDIANPYENLCE